MHVSVRTCRRGRAVRSSLALTIVTENGNVLEADPSADSRVPSYNRRVDPRVVLDASALHDDASLKAYTLANDASGTNDDVGSDDG